MAENYVDEKRRAVMAAKTAELRRQGNALIDQFTDQRMQGLALRLIILPLDDVDDLILDDPRTRPVPVSEGTWLDRGDLLIRTAELGVAQLRNTLDRIARAPIVNRGGSAEDGRAWA